MEAYIITGASKGIGLALSHVLAEKGHFVFGVARSFPENWPGTKSFVYDLTESAGIPELMNNILAAVPQDCSKATLINNAGTVAPIGPAGSNPAEEISRSLVLNLTAPMILSGAFIEGTADLSAQKAIINISSGAGRTAYEGWSAYCAGKAGLDHFSRVVQKEYREIKVLSIAPGIIDTAMQEEIRGSSEADFPLIDNFKSYKEQGMLSTPEETAEKLVRLMEREDFVNLGTITDIRDYQ
ncbi:SDR family NAD(P)-dependent oxidoreductase [Planococcus sp. CAU13]|uniref:SDR family NAD(P)-dependent oxidoreductase n=1 Tax=Planococcus sp. CAU13 TaxID=1541197 RepID=UPI00068C806A|nr:SDR family NAD(P)-dependent oxidoreductase [Planococcus sp. CAU13]